MSKRVALKYCGGCDPEFDRVEYFQKIQKKAGDSIEWVTLDEGRYEAVLLIEGCATACPEKDSASLSGNIVSLKNDDLDPGEVVRILLGEKADEN